MRTIYRLYEETTGTSPLCGGIQYTMGYTYLLEEALMWLRQDYRRNGYEALQVKEYTDSFKCAMHNIEGEVL